jgi:rod shape-determining protein MreC
MDLGRYKNLLFLVAVLIAQVIGLAVQVRRPNPAGGDSSEVRLIRYWAITMMAPPEKVVHGSGSGLRGLWTNYLDLRHVRQQNQDLKSQVNRLQLEQAALLEDARQGQRLQSLLAFKEHYIYSTVAAQVIGTAGTDQSRLLYIDKGSSDGLKPDMAVITPDGIVGKLKDVFSHTAQVLVISDQTSGAGVLLASTRLRGVLRGNELGQPQIINLLPDERVKPGEKVVTSGGDQIFPRGLPVGVVDRIVPDTANPPYIDIVIKPAANLGHLEELLVITEAADHLPKTAQQDLQASAVQGELAASQQRASDILAERLPGLTDPTALADTPTGPQQPLVNPDVVGTKFHPPPALHPDHFSPESAQPARALTPGQGVTDPKYPPTAASTAPPADDVSKETAKATTDGKPAKAVTAGGDAKTTGSKTATAKAGDTAKAAAVAKPKVVKPAPPVTPDEGITPPPVAPAPAGDSGTPPQQ